MAPHHEHCVASVVTTRVLDAEGGVLVEAGNFTPVKYFLDRGASEDDDDNSGSEPPTKKRKTAATLENRSRNPDAFGEQTHIPISRASFNLHFPDTLTAKPPKDESIAEDVVFDNEESIDVIPSVINLFDDGYRLKLVYARTKGGAMLLVDVADLSEAVLDALRTIIDSPAVKTKSGIENSKEHPATSCICTLTRSSGPRYTVVRLEATLFWRSGLSAFGPPGVPVGKARIYPDYNILAKTFPDRARDGVDQTPWTPQDFYDHVHVPSKDRDTKVDFNGILDTDLYPFQKRTVHWLLEREGFKYSDGNVRKLPASEMQAADGNFFEPVLDLENNNCYVSHFLGIIKRSLDEGGQLSSRLKGGILAEEMGLGKTVEVIALQRLHQRPEALSRTVHDESGTDVITSKATLIITPPSILQQWRSELSQHAPSLKVMVYEGTSKNSKEILADLTSNDVVLSTYQTLTSEVHYVEDPPKRSMRNPPRDRKRSPLVKIKWWRLILDEAQMVESGVTAAARVACRLSSFHRWAVSGTPFKKSVEDLRGLLIFLRYEPLNTNPKLWSHLIKNHRHVFHGIVADIALRHSKALVSEELRLPTQRRIVLTLPFLAIEQQHYSTMFAEMCEAVGVDLNGAPKSDEWEPPIETMRTCLMRLRQTCLHPQIGSKNRKALGRGQGPLRTVAEVLEVMIDQNESSIRSSERARVGSELLRAHIIGNARDDDQRSEKALEIYFSALETSTTFVTDARNRLAAAEAAHGDRAGKKADTDDEASSSSESSLGILRNSVRTALQLQHTCTFFAATATFQIKSNIDLTEPDSDRYKELEEKESSLYENAKLIRKEILHENSRKAQSLMDQIQNLEKNGQATKLPKIKDLASTGGIESRRIVEKSDELFDVIREGAQVLLRWRAQMADALLTRLVDDDGVETTGDEYEDSTKQQDQLYAYFDAFKAMLADMTTFVSGQDTPLIDHECRALVRAAKTMLNADIVDEVKVQIHAPQLVLDLFAVRDKFAVHKKKEGFSIRGLIHETRALENWLQGHETGPRAAERALVRRYLSDLQSVFSSYSKALGLEGLEKELNLFRSTQNQRLEFYRQLQELSDDVQPYKEELDETLDLKSLRNATQDEEEQANALDRLKTQNRYLHSLREETGAQAGPKICVICQFPFELGVLTVCGHQFCKECIQHWWSTHKTCPVCKARLRTVDFHNITYNPMELRAQEESGPSSPSEPTSSTSNSISSIFSDVDTKLMQEIKSIDLPSRSSYGTKIDTIGRHLLWIREHDPGAKSIIFSQFRDFLDVLGTALESFKIGYARLGRRSDAAERFKRDPAIDCLLLDAKTDSSGLTLVNATHIFISEPLMNPALEFQACARVHRISQTRPTTVWMYVVSGTVEESIYEMAVERRLAHMQSRQSNRMQKSRSGTPAPLQENAIDAANSEEMQSAPISKLLVAGKSGGELVVNDDLWQCLFGKAQKSAAAEPSAEAEMVVGRYRRAEAAEERRDTTGGAAA